MTLLFKFDYFYNDMYTLLKKVQSYLNKCACALEWLDETAKGGVSGDVTDSIRLKFQLLFPNIQVRVAMFREISLYLGRKIT